MAVNKIIVGGVIRVDLTDATADASKIINSYTAYGATGEKITGNLKIITVHTGSTEPSSSLGNDGDIYIEI